MKLVINIIILFILFMFLEIYVCYQHSVMEFGKFSPKILKQYVCLPIKDFKTQYEKFLKNEKNEIPFREELTGKGNLKNDIILILGCSFAWGANLKNKDSFGGRLNKYTGMTVINRAIPGTCISQMIYMLQRGLNIQKPKYVIYTYISDHKGRIYIGTSFFTSERVMFYKYAKNHKLKQKNDLDLLYWHSFLLRDFSEQKFHKKYSKTEKEQFLQAHFLLLNEEIKKSYPEATFILFVFDGDNDIKPMEKTLQKAGVKIIYLSELTDINIKDEKYLLEDKAHPNALVWEIVTPLFVKKMQSISK